MAALLLSGCALTPEQRQAVLQSFAAGLQGGLSSGMAQAQEAKLMVFGGEGHQTYLGCLNCGQYAQDSMHNAYGTFGSAYSPTSVSNAYGQFGSLYGQYSACNPLASDPPVIVDGAGNFYGRLTLNQYNPQATHNSTVLQWLAAVCTH